jgi:SAM-dependent methyltransferase
MTPRAPLRTIASRIAYCERVQSTAIGYRFALKRQYGASAPRGAVYAPWRNAVLQTRREWEAATEQVRSLGLPSYPEPSKNWDGLAALGCILEHVRRSAPVLDAGAARSSMVLPWLFLHGYTNLTGINLDFDGAWRRGPIRYEPGDLTRTRFAADSFDAVVCQSVLEHGVDIDAYLDEMTRILRPGGLLMASVDYFDEPVDLHGAAPRGGAPYRVFARSDIDQLLSAARMRGLALTDPIDLRCRDRAINWQAYQLEFTYLMLTMRKGA